MPATPPTRLFGTIKPLIAPRHVALLGVLLLMSGCSSGSSSGTSQGGAAGTAQGGGGGTSQGGNGGTAQGGNTQGGNAGTAQGGSSEGGSNGGGSGNLGLPAMCDGAPLTEWEQMMLDAHNTWRGSADPPAADMYRVRWDKAIAQNAANWVASCDPDWPHSPDEKRQGVGGYDELGENLSYCGGTACSGHPDVTDGSGKGDGEGWWEERHDYALATDESTGVTSHYTQMMSSNVYAIGCATQKCGAPGPSGWDGEWWWTICQYGPRGQGYWTGTRPYEPGSGGLVDPPASVYDDHPALCGP